MDVPRQEPWLALFHLPGMHPLLFHKLIEVYGCAEEVLGADPSVLRRAGLPGEFAAALADWQRGAPCQARQALRRDLEWARHPRRQLLTPGHEHYPTLLQAIPDPPPLLYVEGAAELLSRPLLAMVGSRKPSPGGRRLARRFAAQLCEAGLGVCSGLALGIDGESHAGALEAEGLTVAVLGSGIDRIYPRRHQALAARIAEVGALVSEFPLGTGPQAWHFPRRNRIITGLSRGVLVVEAALRSGSLVSARCALEQGRDVFAMPGSPDNPASRGCHWLIKQGARLVDGLDDVLEELDWAPRSSGTDAPANEGSEGKGGLSTLEAGVLAHVGYDTVSVDGLQEATGLEASRLSVALVQLEMQGRIERVAGGYTLV